MAKRKISIQRNLGVKGAAMGQSEADSAIDQLAGTMSTGDVGFKPTDHRVYEIDLDRIMPDPTQPRRLLPHDLKTALEENDLSAAEAMRELIRRADQGDTVALLILGGREARPVEEEDIIVEDTGLLALAQSIHEIGLRHPLNVYRVDEADQPDRTMYRLGEGERRYWAHQLLMQQGYESYSRAKCIVEILPDDEEIIHQRQEAENAARIDLPAIARARSMERIKERLNLEMGTRVPGESTIKLPGQRELQLAVGQRVKSFTGRAIGDRMVRNYLALLTLDPEAQDLAEAAQLSEKQLRPVIRLKTDQERLAMIRRIVAEKWSGSQVLQQVTAPSLAKSSLKEISQRSVEQRFEKRVIDAAKTMHALLTLPQQHYDEAVTALASRAQEPKMRLALQSLRQTLEDILLRLEQIGADTSANIALLAIEPPLDTLGPYLPAEEYEQLKTDVLTGSQILDQLLAWQAGDALLASRLQPLFDRIEADVQSLRAGESLPQPRLKGERNPSLPDLITYEVVSGTTTYWAHELLLKRGENRFEVMRAEVIELTYADDAQ
jgi:hypothetical protein